MSFTITPKGGQTSQTSGATTTEQPQLSARERAVQAFKASERGMQQAAEQPVQNANNVTPEEISAIKPSTKTVSGQEHINEASTEPVSETPSEATDTRKEEPLSNQYAILARKEKQLRAKIQAQEAATRTRETELKAREAALEAKLNSQKSDYESKYVSKDSLLQNPIQALSELGLTYDQLTQYAMNAPKAEDVAREQHIKRLEAKLAELETGQKKVLETFEESQQNSYKQALNQMRVQAQSLVKTDPSYETIAAYGKEALDEVVTLIERTWNEDQILLDVEEAVKAVEEELTERALKFARLNKIQQRIKPATSPVVKQQVAEAPKQTTQVKTLTNQMGASKPLNAKQRAILAFKGELKS